LLSLASEDLNLGDNVNLALRIVKQFLDSRQLRNEDFQTWHGHLAREKRAFSHEMSQGITGKMPVPRYFATPSDSLSEITTLPMA
jgi:hypothetical protein